MDPDRRWKKGNNGLKRLIWGLVAGYLGLSLDGLLRLSTGYPVLPWLIPLATLTAFMAVALHSCLLIGWKHTVYLGLICLIVSLTFECVGVQTGWIYGPYHYGSSLGVKFLGLVPILIPAAWFMMMVPSLWIALIILRGNRLPFKLSWRQVVEAAGLGAVIMTSWDIVMDPVMVLDGHWVWDGSIAAWPVFGIPLQNYLGWWITAFVTYLIFFWITGRKSVEVENPAEYWPVLVIFIATDVASLISAQMLGLVGSALVGFFAMLPWLYMTWKAVRVYPSLGV
jgi:uncharacterized membrane protein